MSNLQAGPLPQDRLPAFQPEEVEVSKGPSLLTENRQLKQILPSYQVEGKLARLIQRIKEIIAKIIFYFYPTEKPDYCALVGALDRAATPMKPQQMTFHLKQFLFLERQDESR